MGQDRIRLESDKISVAKMRGLISADRGKADIIHHSNNDQRLMFLDVIRHERKTMINIIRQKVI